VEGGELFNMRITAQAMKRKHSTKIMRVEKNAESKYGQIFKNYIDGLLVWRVRIMVAI